MAKYPVVIPYLKTPDKGSELKYALRSLKNLTEFNGKVFIVGMQEAWFNNITVIPCKKRSYSPYEDSNNKMLAVIGDERIPDNFILMNDDFYITSKTTLKPLHKGELPKDGKGYHMKSKVATRRFLEAQGIKNPLDYSVHAPMLMNKRKRLEVHHLIRSSFRGTALLARSVYGNLFIDPSEAEYYEDQKTKTPNLKSGVYISTAYYTDELKKLFPKPSKYEGDEARPTVHMIWLGSPLPEKYQRNIMTYENQGYRVKLWTKPITKMINKKLYDSMKTWAGKADVLRLEILYQHGGIYTDVDSKMLSPLPITSDLICMTSASGYIANETIYSTKEHPAIKEALDNLPNHLKKLRRKCNIWEICGATYLTPIFSKHKHIKLPHKFIGSRRKRPSIIEHSYDGSWSEGESKGTPRELDYWLYTDIIRGIM